MRSSAVADALVRNGSLTSATARKRISRVVWPVVRLNNLLPKREVFLHLDGEWNSDRFWASLLRDLRETGSVFGMAIDGLLARGGTTRVQGFKVVSGAPEKLKGQVSSDRLIARLTELGLIEEAEIGELGTCVSLRPTCFPTATLAYARARMRAEAVLMDGLRDWSRKLSLASYNKIEIRTGSDRPTFMNFAFDLVGPSYLLPLVTTKSGAKPSPGFLVADVFCGATLSLDQTKYFFRKVQLLKSIRTSRPFLPILLADAFEKEALAQGKSIGIVMATTQNLFGRSVAEGMSSLVDTLARAAAIASVRPEAVDELLGKLGAIEGAAGNLRGALFEFLVGYLVKEREGNSIDIGEIVRDPRNGDQAEIDVRRIKERQECWSYECRARQPSSQISLADVDDWITRVNRILAAHRAEDRFRKSRFGFELWTTGTFHPDAVDRLKTEKGKRTGIEICWRDGAEVREYAKACGNRSVLKTLDEHYFEHPLA
jgi:hypothetical protein